MTERPYKPTDLDELIQVYTAAIRSLAAPFYSPEQIAAWAPAIPDLARWQKRLAELHTLVAECDGVLAGFASYKDDGYLDFLYTRPSFARRGVATRLYRRVESAFRARRVTRVSTHASLAARAFFEHHGFELDAEESVECRGVYLRRLTMHKKLDRPDL